MVLARSSWFVLAAAVTAAGAVEAVLPPELPWDGRSRTLVAPPGDPWVTPAETSGLRRTPRYDETVAFLQRLAAASPDLALVSLGRSPEGRDIWMAVAAAGGGGTPEALARNGRPTVLAHAGIHAGEIDGKDAGLMLLRDLTAGGRRRDLLSAVNLLFVPILNVDGHERFSRYGRINQRGPEETGWRTTARNLNLNRDFAKLDAPETRMLVEAIGAWKPDLYLDLHVTDGADYQYDVTWGYNGAHALSPAIAGWLDARLTPAVRQDLEGWGHVPGPVVFPVDAGDPAGGLAEWVATPRFSNGYGDARHLPTVLLETHSLKPYPQRVLGTYVFLWSVLRVVGERGAELRRAAAEDRARRPAEVPLEWSFPSEPARTIDFLGVEMRREPSAAAGGDGEVWTGRPVTMRVPVRVMSRPARTVTRPAAYWVPPAWTEVIDRLGWHGIQLERQTSARELDAEVYRIADDAGLEKEPFEGRARVEGSVGRERRRVALPAGSVRVPTDQPLGDLAILLLEPDSPDSFFRWGLFLEVMQATEYVEGYVIDPTAARMLAGDPGLAREFERALEEDADLAGDPERRRRWLYRRTPYFDERYRLYPVVREP
jgi:murein tripeptide amidase MpaA